MENTSLAQTTIDPSPIRDMLATPEYAAVKIMIEVLRETEFANPYWAHLNAIDSGMQGLSGSVSQ